MGRRGRKLLDDRLPLATEEAPQRDQPGSCRDELDDEQGPDHGVAQAGMPAIRLSPCVGDERYRDDHGDVDEQDPTRDPASVARVERSETWGRREPAAGDPDFAPLNPGYALGR
jgi:hypothetical protein